jgi:hypothetical protein
MPNGGLETYLNDHLAGAQTALELLARLVDGATDAADRQRFASLRSDITADQAALRQLLMRLGGKESSVKRALGWLAEKASRVKLGATPKGDPFPLFEALEMLALGIEGKRSLWRALGAIALSHPTLASLDLAGLERRAATQHDDVERMRLAIAPEALLPG